MRDRSDREQLRFVVNLLDRERSERLATVKLQRTMQLLTSPHVTQELLDSQQEFSVKLLESIADMATPWRDAARKMQLKSEFTKFREDYIRAFGEDPSSPEFKAKEAEKIRKLRAQRAAEDEQESDTDRITRLMREARKAKKR